MSGAQVEKTLDGQDPEVKFKARKYLDDLNRFDENQTKRMQETNYKALYNAQTNYMQQNPGATPLQFQQTKAYKSMIRNLDPSQQKTINNMMAPPKVSDTEAIDKVQAVLAGNGADYGLPSDPSKMTADQIAQVTSGLGTDYQGKMLTQRMWGAVDPSNTQKNQQYTQSMAELKNQALTMGLVKPDNDFKNGVKPGGAEAKKLSALQNGLLDYMDKMGPMSHEQVRKEVANYLTTQQAAKTSVPWYSNIFSGASPTAAPPQGGKSQVEIMAQAKKEFIQQNGVNPTVQQLQQYVQENLKRLQR